MTLEKVDAWLMDLESELPHIAQVGRLMAARPHLPTTLCSRSMASASLRISSELGDMVEGDFFIRFAFFEPPPSAALLLLATFLLPFEEPFRDRLMLDDLGELLRRTFFTLPLDLMLFTTLVRALLFTTADLASADLATADLAIADLATADFATPDLLLAIFPLPAFGVDLLCLFLLALFGGGHRGGTTFGAADLTTAGVAGGAEGGSSNQFVRRLPF
ncbi:hypothetical protein TYRP_004914 [Tyrophagus putrescentiae]|nr:hypothetical protein TYRP_004914 [Tyrophagus putrescentiae]